MSEEPSLLRKWTLLCTLSARRQGATLRELAGDAGVSSKTILRDLEMLREQRFPLVHATSDHGRNHWKLDRAKGLLQIQFTVEEAAALYLGRQFLEPLAGTYFFADA
jgi:predicted DNA-binding transcriptional regulator YafY